VITIKTILVPTDFSECSEQALAYGRAMAATFGATLHLLHVVQDPYTQPWAAEAFPAPLGDMLAQWQEQARVRLEGLVPDGERAGVLVAVQVGGPFQEIVAYAEAQHIDLIVIGTHGRGPLGHMLLGSVAEKVVRRAPCPVLTVRQKTP
jgi:universal stress protein A